MGFSYDYRRGDEGGEDLEDRWKGLGIVSLKRELKRRGLFTFAGELTDKFGRGLHRAVERFQEAEGLKADGVVGTRTLSVLIKPYVARYAHRFEIPGPSGEGSWLRGVLTKESHNDPGAFYFDPLHSDRGIDRGPAMLNSWSYPDVTDERCSDYGFATDKAAQRLVEGFNRHSNPKHGKTWPLAVAYYHSPGMALDWDRYGLENMPTSGDMSGEERATHIRSYVDEVRSMCDGIPK